MYIPLKNCYTALVIRTFVSAVSFLSAVPVAFAQGVTGKLQVNTGTKIDFWTLIGNVLGFLANAALFIAPVIFLIGVLYYTIGGATGDTDKGKDIMKTTLKGFVLIIGAYSILRTVYFFLQG